MMKKMMVKELLKKLNYKKPICMKTLNNLLLAFVSWTYTLLEDPYARHFADEQSKEFDEKISLIEERKWKAETFDDDVLKDVVSYTLSPNKSIKESKPVTDLVKAKVRGRLSKLWRKANKEQLKSEDGKKQN